MRDLSPAVAQRQKRHRINLARGKTTCRIGLPVTLKLQCLSIEIVGNKDQFAPISGNEFLPLDVIAGVIDRKQRELAVRTSQGDRISLISDTVVQSVL